MFNRNKVQLNGKASFIDSDLFTAYQLIADVSLTPNLFIFGGVSRTFRAPTLNDLYWRPGGNPDLVPEQAYAVEFGLKSLVTKSNFQSSAELTSYFRNTENWMLWAFNPELNYWSASNINEVESYGLEAQTNLETKPFKNSNLRLSLGGQLVNSLFLESLSLPNIEEGSQMYYVPKLSSHGELVLAIQELEISYFTAYRSQQEGVLYTIPEFMVHDASIARTFHSSLIELSLAFNAKNIFNARYEMVEYRPLPGRYFEIEINLKTK
jgi:iron complex outermembrane receptor protein